MSTLGAGVLGDTGNELQFNGNGFRANLNPPTLSFTGSGYFAELQATLDGTNYITFNGRGYKVTPEFLGGFIFNGQGYSVSPDFTLSPDYNVNFTGRGYSTTLDAVLETSTDIAFTGRGYKAALESLGGFLFAGRGYRASLTSTVIVPERISFTGRGYAASLEASGKPVTLISFTGRGFAASLARTDFTGRGYAVQSLFSFEIDTTYAEAFVMNILGSQVTRYQNFPFSHLAKIGSKYYGVNANGLYELTGTADIDTDVNGTVLTPSTDFSDFKSKNVAYMYLNGDDDYTVTPLVDSVEQPSYQSGFSGRRVKMARGNKGRYWEFRIEGITHLQGVEYLPDGISRRVK